MLIDAVLRSASSILILVVIVMPLFSCSGRKPETLGIRHARFSPCPSTPNCVSSDADDEAHRIPAFELAVPPAEGWRVARSLVADLPRTRMVTATSDYIHAECSSAVFGFVDDLELHLRPAQNIIAVRSAARLGFSDFRVNRKRVETLRALLLQQRVIR
ncbi:MAG TPA: DUF1499 domain-containing protein [Candidatus Binatia bacterium]|nr:DUF1499 domain-containing protein [Candidatus Binatia bacterium]